MTVGKVLCLFCFVAGTLASDPRAVPTSNTHQRTLKFRIPNLSLLSRGEHLAPIADDVIRFADHRWRLWLLPREADGDGIDAEEHVSACLERLDSSDGDCVDPLNVAFSVALLHSADDVTAAKRCKRHDFGSNTRRTLPLTSSRWLMQPPRVGSEQASPSGSESDEHTTVELRLSMRQAEAPLMGLRNQGNTCYLNSVLQNLFNVPPLRRALAEYSVSNSTGGSDEFRIAFDSTVALMSVFEQLQAAKSAARPAGVGASTRKLTQSMQIDPRLQQDASEFRGALIALLEDAGLGPEVSSALRGVLAHRVQGAEDHTLDKVWEESFLELNIEVRNSGDVDSALNRYFEEESLTGDNRYRHKKELIDAVKTARLRKPPAFLTLLLKRFDFDLERGGLVKIGDSLHIPAALDLKRFVEPGAGICDALYELQAAVIHIGDGERGHYYAYVRSGEQWWLIDDENATPVSENQALSDMKGDVLSPGSGAGCVSRSAYMLQYQKQTSGPPPL